MEERDLRERTFGGERTFGERRGLLARERVFPMRYPLPLVRRVLSEEAGGAFSFSGETSCCREKE